MGTASGRGALVVLVLVGTGACSTGDPFAPLPVPDSIPETSTTTAPPPDLSGVALAPVEGTTTTSEVVVGPGPATLAGRVDGPDGPVAGATVRLERLVGEAVATMEVATGDDGLWRASDVLGGRYRVRAWRVPDLAAIEPQILFAGGGATSVPLVVERFDATVADLAVAPNPPPVGGRTNVLVRLSSQVVGNDGVVRVGPLPGVAVSLGLGGSWALEGPSLTVTDAAGGATFTLVCSAPGPQPLMASVSDGESFDLTPPACEVPPPPTVVPPATAPAEGSPTSTTSR